MEKSKKRDKREKGKGLYPFPHSMTFTQKTIAACGNQEGELVAFRRIFPDCILYAFFELK